MAYHSKRYKPISVEEMNALLEECKHSYILEEGGVGGLFTAHYTQTRAEFRLSFSHNNYVCRLDDDITRCVQITGAEAWRMMQCYWKIKPLTTMAKIKSHCKMKDGIIEDIYCASASPILGYRKEFNRKKIEKIYVYDLNSAYASVIIKARIPNFNDDLGWGVVQENEVGFCQVEGKSLDADYQLVMCDVGDIADYRFKLIDNPLVDFVKSICLKKKTALDPKEKAKYKQILNSAIGYAQRVNPCVRAYIVESCNRRIQNLLDKYESIVFWNTDAVYSLTPLPLDIGDDIGQFKLEYEGGFQYNGFNYKKDDELNWHIRGKAHPIYEYNVESNRLEVMEWVEQDEINI